MLYLGFARRIYIDFYITIQEAAVSAYASLIEEIEMPNEESFLQDLLPYLLQRSSHLVTRQFHQHLRLRKVSLSRWRMLAWLAENEPDSVNQLAEQLMLRQPSVTNLVDKSVQDGLIVKTPDPKDARRVQIRLTAKGRVLADTLKSQARLAEAEFAANFGQERIDEVKKVLRHLIRFSESGSHEELPV